MKLEHFFSEIGGTRMQEPSLQEPSAQTVQQARTLGRVAVGNADIIYKKEHGTEYIVVIQHGEAMRYRDMYRIA